MALNKFKLPFKNLSELTTDGAPTMVGTQKGLSALAKKEMSCLSLDASNLPVCHSYIKRVCVHIHWSLTPMETVVSTTNFITSRGLNNHQFKKLLNEYNDLVYQCKAWQKRKKSSAVLFPSSQNVQSFLFLSFNLSNYFHMDTLFLYDLLSLWWRKEL